MNMDTESALEIVHSSEHLDVFLATARVGNFDVFVELVSEEIRESDFANRMRWDERVNLDEVDFELIFKELRRPVLKVVS